MNYKTKLVHINNINSGDTVVHDGELKTVSLSNLKRCPFMGKSLFGDTYELGSKPVVLAFELKG